MEYNTSTVWGGKVGTQLQQKLITKAAAKQTYLLTTKNYLDLIQIEWDIKVSMFILQAKAVKIPDKNDKYPCIRQVQSVFIWLS